LISINIYQKYNLSEEKQSVKGKCFSYKLSGITPNKDENFNFENNGVEKNYYNFEEISAKIKDR
jgi:hypothetical protein